MTETRAFPLPRDVGEDLYAFLAADTRPIIVYGMGNGADKLIVRLAAIGREVADFFASDGFVRGQYFHGKRVLSFAEVKEKYPSFVVLVCFGSNRENVINAIYSLADNYETYIPDLPVAGKEDFTADYFQRHYGEIRRVYGMLADEPSRRVYCEMLRYKLSGRPAHLRAAVKDDDVWELLGASALARTVDVGAYRGDTLAELVERAPALREVYAVEPDEKNHGKLVALAATYGAVTVHCVHGAAWDSAGELFFDASGNRNATLSREPRSLDTTASYQHKRRRVPAVTVDGLLDGRSADYIKYDTEGAEREALIGSRETVRRFAPRLRVAAYHRSEDLFALPLLLEEMAPDTYRYYYRRKPCIPCWEVDLVAVPKTEKE